MEGLKGKRVLVTGAGSGIGRATALRFAEEGAHVAVNYRGGESEAREVLEAVERHSRRSFIVKADVSREVDVEGMFRTCRDRWGGLDVLVNNAGFQLAEESHRLEVKDFDSVLATNLRGAFLCARQALRIFLETGSPGVIVNVSSVHEVIPKPRFLGYSVSKGGMRNLTTTLALEYADRNIRVNAVAPGAIVTPMNRAWIEDPERRAEVEGHIPLGRAGEDREIAAMICFLCSDEAAYVTGQTIFVDGGLTLYADFRESWASE